MTDRVRVFGAGPRKALALHCGLAHGGAWAALAAKLPPDMELHAPDLPGHGTAPAWKTGDYLSAALDVAEKSAPTGRFDLLGHSFGGVLALAVAARHRDRIRSLTLYEPVLFALARAENRPEVAEHDRAFAPYIAALQAGDREAATRAFTGVWGGATPWEAIPETQRVYMIDRIHTIRASNPILNDDAAGLLQPGVLDRIDAPVLLLSGGASPPITQAICESLSARLPDARHLVLPGCGHMAPITRADRLAGVVRPFLERSAPI